jgi:hypothetical protein
MGTFGELRLDGSLLCYTVERPWIGVDESGSYAYPAGKPFDSCIPAGLYELKPWDSDKHPDTLCLVNEMLSVFQYDEGYGRYGILIHTANWMSDVEGCIGFGKDLAYARDRYGVNRWMVTHSGDTTKNILALLKMRNVDRLKIQWRKP